MNFFLFSHLDMLHKTTDKLWIIHSLTKLHAMNVLIWEKLITVVFLCLTEIFSKKSEIVLEWNSIKTISLPNLFRHEKNEMSTYHA